MDAFLIPVATACIVWVVRANPSGDLEEQDEADLGSLTAHPNDLVR
jgi:hypothetical protein